MSRFHPSCRWEFAERSMAKALAAATVTEDDIALVRKYIHEREATGHITLARQLKICFTLIHWRWFIPQPFRTMSIDDVFQGISDMKIGKSSRGRPFAQNTQHDWVVILKPFLLWLIESEINLLPFAKVQKISAPAKDYYTTDPKDLPTAEEIKKLVAVCLSARDRALVWTHYETGARIGEVVANLQWKDLKFDEYGVQVTITDTKTRKIRHARIVAGREDLVQYRKYYHRYREPVGDALVFVTADEGLPLTYPTVVAMYRRAAERAGFDPYKFVKTHRMRHFRTKTLLLGKVPESVVKETLFGNQNSQQLKVYFNPTMEDIDNQLLEHSGIRKAEAIAFRDPLAPRQCNNCGMVNGPELVACQRCGEPLTEEAISRSRQIQEYISKHPEIIKQWAEEQIRNRGKA